MKLNFKAEVDGLLLTLTAERIYRSKQAERYRLSINGTNYSVVIQTNRPAVENSPGKAAQWFIVEGNAKEKTRLQPVYEQLEKAILHQPPSFQGTLNFIDCF